MGNVSLMGFLENLALIGPLLLMLLLPAGFIGSAWVTNTVFDYFGRDRDEATTFDRVGTLLLLGSLFAAYAYIVCGLLLE